MTRPMIYASVLWLTTSGATHKFTTIILLDRKIGKKEKIESHCCEIVVKILIIFLNVEICVFVMQ